MILWNDLRFCDPQEKSLVAALLKWPKQEWFHYFIIPLPHQNLTLHIYLFVYTLDFIQYQHLPKNNIAVLAKYTIKEKVEPGGTVTYTNFISYVLLYTLVIYKL